MEREADYIGMQLMAKACFDPHEMPKVTCKKKIDGVLCLRQLPLKFVLPRPALVMCTVVVGAAISISSTSLSSPPPPALVFYRSGLDTLVSMLGLAASDANSFFFLFVVCYFFCHDQSTVRLFSCCLPIGSSS